MALLDFTIFGNPWYDYLIFLAFIAGGVIAGKVFFWISTNIIKVFTKKTETRLDDLIIHSLERPVIFLLFTIGFKIGCLYLDFGEKGTNITNNIAAVLVTLNVAWFIMNILDALIENYLQPAAAKGKTMVVDNNLIPLLRKGLKAVIVLITIILIIDNYGYDVTSLVAGLGLGGLAFALAAQDLLSNFFGGLAIISDKPFKVGDRIKLDDKTDGFIREIGIRTTRMETFDGTYIVVPNSKLASSILENISKEPARRIVMTIGVTYDTNLQKLEKAKKIIKDIIKKEPDVRDDATVAFINFGPSSLDIRVIYWITNLKHLFSAQDSINTQIKREFEKAKIEFAYPTQTVYVKK